MQLADLFELSLFGASSGTQLGVVLKPLVCPSSWGRRSGALLLAAAAYHLALAFIVSRRRLSDILLHNHH